MNHLSPGTVPPQGADAVVPDPASALSTAALVALRAPSLHGAPTWHWRIATDRVELYADEPSVPRTGRRDGRWLLSCGAAVHHARVALRGLGYLPAVRRLPDQTRPELLATVAVHKPIQVTPYAAALLRATLGQDAAPAAAGYDQALVALREAAAAEGAWLELLDDGHIAVLASVAAERPDGRAGEAPRNGHRHSRYAVLYGASDRATAWLRAGEAFSAVWLTAVRHRLHVRPLDAITQSEQASTVLQRLTRVPGLPYLVLHVTAPANGGVPAFADGGVAAFAAAAPAPAAEAEPEPENIH